MKKLLLALAVTGMVTTAAVAQDQKDYKKERTEWDKKIKTELNLSADQTVKYDAISKEYNDKIDAVAQDAGLNKDAQKERKMTLKKEKEARLSEVFTPDQQARYKELMEKKKKEHLKPAS